MRVDIVSLFPEFVAQCAAFGVVGRAQELPARRDGTRDDRPDVAPARDVVGEGIGARGRRARALRVLVELGIPPGAEHEPAHLVEDDLAVPENGGPAGAADVEGARATERPSDETPSVMTEIRCCIVGS